MLSLDACRDRQRRFAASLAEARLDAALISHPRDVYYFTGLWVENKNFGLPSLLALGADLESWLGTWADDPDAAVSNRDTYPPGVFATMNPDNHRRLARLAEAAGERLRGKLHRVGYQAEGGSKHVVDAFLAAAGAPEVEPIDDLLARQQLRKDADEIAAIGAAQRANLACYARAAEVIEPGVTELEVLSQCHRAAIAAASKQHYFSGDFRCGEPGGPARDRPIEAGEIYIIDAWSDVDGYWSDLCRAWCVGGRPTELQQEVYNHLAAILGEAPGMVEPGGCCRDFWRWLDARIREHPKLADVGLTHHGGHGIGLRAHEGPDISRDRDGVFEVGCTFTVEPGVYIPELRGGIRLENNFLLTEVGVENLSPFSFELDPQR